MIRNLLPINKSERLVYGLRDGALASDCRVYKQNPDGSKELVGIEPAKYWSPNFTRAKKKSSLE